MNVEVRKKPCSPHISCKILDKWPNFIISVSSYIKWSQHFFFCKPVLRIKCDSIHNLLLSKWWPLLLEVKWLLKTTYLVNEDGISIQTPTSYSAWYLPLYQLSCGWRSIPDLSGWEIIYLVLLERDCTFLLHDLPQSHTFNEKRAASFGMNSFFLSTAKHWSRAVP